MYNREFKLTSINLIVRLSLGPVLILFLPFFLTADQQGLWFLMTSLAAFLSFSELGLSTAVVHAAAHEYANIKSAIKTSDYEKADIYQNRLYALLLYSIRRVAIMACVALPVLLSLGIYLFHSHNSGDWIQLLPWVFFCLVSAGALILTILLSYLEGCDGVARIQHIRAVVAIINIIALLGGLACGLTLWSLPLATTLGTAYGFMKSSKLWPQNVYKSNVHIKKNINNWAIEMNPLLLRYMGSWVGGYIMFQLFTPITYRLLGPVVAGKVGLSISIFTSIFTISNVWSTYQLPNFSMAIAALNRTSLERCLLRAMSGSVITYLVLATSFFLIYYLLQDHPVISSRLISPPAMLLLAVAWFAQLIVHNLAIYLRAFREDPIVWHTIIASIYTIISTILTIHYLGENYIFIGFVTVYIWLVPSVLLVSRRKRQETLQWPAINVQHSGSKRSDG